MPLNDWHDALTKSVLETHEPFAAMKQTDDEFSAARRIDVYRNNYQQGLLSALESGYPNTRQIVGEKYFRQLSSHYVMAHPPQQADLNQYGSDFPQFIQQLQEQRPELSKMGYLADLAELDWCLYQVYFSPDRKAWPANEFLALSAEQQASCSLCLSPDVYLISSPWPLYELWQLNRDEVESVDLAGHTDQEFLVIFRQGFKSCVATLAKTEFELLTAIQAKQTITTLTELFPAAMDRLPVWIQCGWLNDFQLEPEK